MPAIQNIKKSSITIYVERNFTKTNQFQRCITQQGRAAPIPLILNYKLCFYANMD